MFDLLSQILEFLAPFIVATHLLFMLAVAVICSFVVVLLAYYLVRFAGFAISWQPKDFVGAPPQPSSIRFECHSWNHANERHATTLLRQTAPISTLNDGDKLQKELLDYGLRIRPENQIATPPFGGRCWRLRTLENLMQKIHERQQQKELTK